MHDCRTCMFDYECTSTTLLLCMDRIMHAYYTTVADEAGLTHGIMACACGCMHVM
jgi:hypothetical protein